MPESIFPTLNASLNFIAFVFLLLGRREVKRGKLADHKRMMILALATSALFLSSYLYYHFVVGSEVTYEGAALMRTLYLIVLIPHVILATLQVPFIGIAVWAAFTQRFTLHVSLVKWVWPVWVYVSITGVMVYLMLYILPHG